jgi:hypothetical protein
VADVARLHKQL